MSAEKSLIAALRAIANGTNLNPIRQDPAAELARIDVIAMEAIVEYEAGRCARCGNTGKEYPWAPQWSAVASRPCPECRG